jgi:hypothetical protein
MRERLVPADADRPPANWQRPVESQPGDPSFEEFPEFEPRGPAPPMFVTTATRLSSRFMTTGAPTGDAVRAWLARLPADLIPFAPAGVAPAGSHSPAEVHAITRALACPDLFLIDASAQSSRENTIAQIAERAADRVLVLSPDSEAADRLTERMAGAGVVRALADDENPIRSSPVVARLTSTALGIEKADRLRRDVAEALERAESQLAPAERFAAINSEIAEATAMRDRLGIEIRARYDNSAIARREAELAALRRRLTESSAEQAGRKAGFFAWLFGRSSSVQDPTKLEKEIEVAAAEVAAMTAEREDSIRDDQLVRRAPLDSRLADLVAERDRMAAAQREHSYALARERELDAPNLVRRLLAESRVVVGTPGSLDADPVFIDSPPFALLVLDRCEELAEADFLRLCPLAARWVLVGKVNDRPSAHRPRGGIDGRAGRNGRSKGSTFVDGLAQLLDREPWEREGDRIVCRLMHEVGSTGRQTLVQEPLFDRPEIELRFTAEGDPAVAEVAFPAGTSIADAKAFLFRQLGEVLLHPCGILQWEEAAESIVARWSEYADCTIAWIDLEPGVREKVVCCGWAAFTTAVQFDRTLNWDRERAEAWMAHHHRPESAGRFVTVSRTSEPKRL